MKTHLFTLAIFFLLLASCHHTDEPPAPRASVQLSAVDTGVVDAQIRLQVNGSNVAYAVAIKRDGRTIFASPQPASGGLTDTTVLDTALLPRHTYAYKAYAFVDGRAIDSSALLPLTTMDTTSHDIQWTLDTLGEGASSMLNDVCIINETCVWAVGSISVKDSNGNWVNPPYNAANWNGRLWELLKVPTKMYPNIDGVFPLKTVFAFGPNDIWTFSDAGSYSHWDGTRWSSLWISERSGGGLKFWGTSSSDLYLVGTNGSISHFNGSSWTWIPSGTTLDIQDIWGAKNPRTGEWEILAVAGNFYENRERKILKIHGSSVTSLSDSNIYHALNSVWFISGKQYWVAGGGVWEKPYGLDCPLWIGGVGFITSYATNRVRGTDANDLFICGAYGDLRHFNGISWHSYKDQTNLASGYFHSIDVSSGLVIAVGENNPLAAVAIGQRNGRLSGREERH